MSTENSTLESSDTSNDPNYTESYWIGLVKRVGISLAILAVWHIAARIAAGKIAEKEGLDFSTGFAMDLTGHDAWMAFVGLVYFHLSGLMLIILFCGVPLLILWLLYLFVRWLFDI